MSPWLREESRRGRQRRDSDGLGAPPRRRAQPKGSPGGTWRARASRSGETDETRSPQSHPAMRRGPESGIDVTVLVRESVNAGRNSEVAGSAAGGSPVTRPNGRAKGRDDRDGRQACDSWRGSAIGATLVHNRRRKAGHFAGDSAKAL